MFNPSAETRIEAGDEVIVLGGSDQTDRLRASLNYLRRLGRDPPMDPVRA